MSVTKETLQLFCKTLGISATGTKDVLKKKICAELCSGTQYVTLRSLLRKKEDIRLPKIVEDMYQMLDDDSSTFSIVKSLGSLHNVKIEKVDVEIFAEIIDASGKKDWEFIEDNIEQWGKKASYAIKLVKVYAANHNIKKLLEVLE